jgi:hypothetical protein
MMTTTPLVSPLIYNGSNTLVQFHSYILGLTERRERKRAKRAIVQPKELAVTEDNDDNKKTDKSKKDKKSKIPAGFALMHGFSATNVGKNRLTVSYDGSPLIFANFP